MDTIATAKDLAQAAFTGGFPGTCGNRKSVLRDVLEGMVLDALRDTLMAPDVVESFVAEFQAEVNRQRGAAEQATTRLRRELEQVERRLDGLIEAIADGRRTAGTLGNLQALEARKAELEISLQKAPGPQPRLHPNLALLYRRKVEALSETLADPALRPQALEVLRRLIERIEMRPRDDGFEIEVVGEIAYMVEAALGADSKKAAPLSEVAACSLKVVAGAGFEPATFRL